MFNSRERALVLRWSGNLLARVGVDSPAALELTDWLHAHADELGLARDKDGPLAGRHPVPTRQEARSRHSSPPGDEGRPSYVLARTAGLRARVRSQLRLPTFSLGRHAAKYDEQLARPDGRVGSFADAKLLRRKLLAPTEEETGSDGLDFAGLVERAQSAAAEADQGDGMLRHLTNLAALVGLDAQESAALELLLRYETRPPIQAMVDVVCGIRGNGFSLLQPTLGWLLGVCPAVVRRLFRADGCLLQSGLVSVDEGQRLTLVGRLNRLAWSIEGGDVRRLLLGGEGDSELDWSDFQHLGAALADVEGLIRGAAEAGARGVNILVYGLPGTGKTAFCQTLAKHLRLALFSVGESSGAGAEPLRSERLSELRLAQSLLAADRHALLLFDEMEDLLVGGGEAAIGFAPPLASGASRVFLHRLLERAPTPTLWTTHDAESLHPAVLRRMMYAVRMPALPVSVRTRIWSRQLALHGIVATLDDTRALAREFDASPGLAAAATAAAHIGKGGLGVVRRGVQSLSTALGSDLHIRRARTPLLPDAGVDVPFDPSLIEADTDFVALADRLAAAETRTFSLCLQGPPGTGKTASLHYLAERLELDLVEVRGAELLGMWQGDTERNIADAFASAAEHGTFLVIDQADTLLAEREASYGWEMSAGSEVLAWMEHHPLPFACTARDDLRLDQVALRQFVFRCAFGFLGPARAARAFRLWFGRGLSDDLRLPASLTPGDFRVARRRAALLGALDSDETLVAMLREESRIAPPRGRALGFGVDPDRAFGQRRRTGAAPQPKARASARPLGRHFTQRNADAPVRARRC